MSCSNHEYESSISSTRIRGNNYDIETTWVTRSCKHCRETDKRPLSHKQIPHGDYKHADQLTSPARFGT